MFLWSFGGQGFSATDRARADQDQVKQATRLGEGEAETLQECFVGTSLQKLLAVGACASYRKVL